MPRHRSSRRPHQRTCGRRTRSFDTVSLSRSPSSASASSVNTNSGCVAWANRQRHSARKDPRWDGYTWRADNGGRVRSNWQPATGTASSADPAGLGELVSPWADEAYSPRRCLVPGACPPDPARKEVSVGGGQAGSIHSSSKSSSSQPGRHRASGNTTLGHTCGSGKAGVSGLSPWVWAGR
jgi:hypothetical protein